MRCKRRSALIGLLTGSAALAAASLAQVQSAAAAATETVLHKFKGGSDGANPHAGLISDSTGALYGTTWRGGGTGCVGGLGCGTVFKLPPPAAGQTKWTKEILYRFQGGSDGEAPLAPLILDSTGALYGTTLAGGVSFGLGTVFKLTPPAAGQTLWTETILYRFGGVGGDGIGPEAGLIFDSKGALYGTTAGGGGASNCGTVFKLKPPAAGLTQWTEKVLSDLPSGGANPIGDPLLCPANGGQPDCTLPPGGPMAVKLIEFLLFTAETDASGVLNKSGDILLLAIDRNLPRS
jgi:uncharacterized repeat protein (TIGR03803 family)